MRVFVLLGGVLIASIFVALFFPALWKRKELFSTSPLLGKPVKQFKAETLDGKTFNFPPSHEKILLNFFASWCTECSEEREILKVLKERYGFFIVGVVFRDRRENILRYLEKSNPYDVVIWDEGILAIEWGVTGVPETFVILDGVVKHKFIGPISIPVLSRILKQTEDAKQSS